METFVRWLNEQDSTILEELEAMLQGMPTPPAIVRTFNPEVEREVDKAIRCVKWVVQQMKNLFDFGMTNESTQDVFKGRRYPGERKTLEPKIFRGCKKLCELVRRHGNPDYDGKLPSTVRCGVEGCGYFFGNNLVVKITFGKGEYQIAKMLMGDLSHFPIIDVETDDENGVYYIAMEELNTSWTVDLIRMIDTSGHLIAGYFKSIINSPQNRGKMEDFLETQMFRDWVKERGYQMNPVAERLFIINREVYKRAGLVIPADLHRGNLGMRLKGGTGDPSKDLQVLDFGFQVDPKNPPKWYRRHAGINPTPAPKSGSLPLPSEV